METKDKETRKMEKNRAKMESRACFPSNVMHYSGRFIEAYGRDGFERKIQPYILGHGFPNRKTFNEIVERTGIDRYDLQYRFDDCNVPVYSFEDLAAVYEKERRKRTDSMSPDGTGPGIWIDGQWLEEHGCMKTGTSQIDGTVITCSRGFAVKYESKSAWGNEELDIAKNFPGSEIIIQFDGQPMSYLKKDQMDSKISIIAPKSDRIIREPIIRWLRLEDGRYIMEVDRKKEERSYSVMYFRNNMFRAATAANIIIKLDRCCHISRESRRNGQYSGRAYYFIHNFMKFLKMSEYPTYDEFGKQNGTSQREIRLMMKNEKRPGTEQVETYARIFGIEPADLTSPGKSIYVPVYSMEYLDKAMESGIIDVNERIDILAPDSDIPVESSFGIFIDRTNLKGFERLERIFMIFTEREAAEPVDREWHLALLYSKEERRFLIRWVMEDSDSDEVCISIQKFKYRDGRNTRSREEYLREFIPFAIATEIHIKDQRYDRAAVKGPNNTK